MASTLRVGDALKNPGQEFPFEADAQISEMEVLGDPVRFEESVRNIVASFSIAPEFVETGFGGVLFGLIKRIDKELRRACVQDAASMKAFLEAHGYAN